MSNLNTSGNIELVTGSHRLQYDAESGTGTVSFSVASKKVMPRVDVHVSQIDGVIAALHRIKGIILAVEPQVAVVDGVSDMLGDANQRVLEAKAQQLQGSVRKLIK